MAETGKAKAGRSSIGTDDLETDGDLPAEGSMRDRAPDAGSAQEQPLAGFGKGQTEAEAQLYAYYGQFATAQPSRFQPMEELSARLNEFDYPQREAASTHAANGQGAVAGPYWSNLDWFEHRFGELKQLLGSPDDGKREIVTINVRLAEIVERLDRLSAGMPDVSALASVESKLADFSQSLDETREQNTANADRISRAAMEIFNVSNRAQEDRRRFEAVARHTVEELGQTVVATASRAAVLTAGEIATSLKRPSERAGVERLESELRALNVQSRESSERTAAALDRVHETLRVFLERGPSGQATAQPRRKRPSVHTPISADSSVYSLATSGFGAGQEREPQLGTITLRAKPTPSDPNLLKALQDAEERLSKGRPAGSETVESRTGFWKAPRTREEEKNHPLAGIAIVAIILLLASAALYYLHTKTHLAPFRLSVMPEAGLAVPSWVAPGAAAPAKAAQVGKLPAEAYPSLFSAASPNVQGAAEEASAPEDLKILEGAARRGDREAQFRIGKRFLSDGDVEGGAITASRWLARAADQGHVEAIFMLASLYERGAGVSKDADHAMDLYRQAASAGHVRAMYNLGVMLSARGSQQDYREAALWFYRAALAGLPDSQYNLAILYERGLGLEQDLTRAYFWYRVAAHAGDKEATQQAERLKRTMPPEETAAAGEQAGSWRPALEDSAKSADGGGARRG
jgi:localization factor PodJL